MKKTYSMDMIHGPLFIKIITYAMPLVLSGVLQLLFNAADTVIVGRFAGQQALAAVGATTSLNFLFFSLCSGLASGIGILGVLVIFTGMQDQASFDNCPKVFRGLPIQMITAGLMALALMGFYGLHVI